MVVETASGTNMDVLRNIETSDGFYAIDMDQRIVHWNESAQRILGFTAEEMIGKNCYDVLGSRDSENYRFCRRNCPIVTSARRGRSTPDYDIRCTTRSGEEKWINVSIMVLKSERRAYQVLHLFRDVNQRRRTEEFARKVRTSIRELLNEDEGGPPYNPEPSPTPVPKLSNREREVLGLLSAGFTTQQIAVELDVRPITARNHITRLLTKLGVENRLQAVLYASEHRLM